MGLFLFLTCCFKRCFFSLLIDGEVLRFLFRKIRYFFACRWLASCVCLFVKQFFIHVAYGFLFLFFVLTIMIQMDSSVYGVYQRYEVWYRFYGSGSTDPYLSCPDDGDNENLHSIGQGAATAYDANGNSRSATIGQYTGSWGWNGNEHDYPSGTIWRWDGSETGWTSPSNCDGKNPNQCLADAMNWAVSQYGQSQVRAINASSSSAHGNSQITVTDVAWIDSQSSWHCGTANTAPHSLSLSNSSVVENSSGATVGTFSASDDEGNTIYYYFSGGDTSYFSLSSSGVLTTSTSLDHEGTSTYTVTVYPQDSEGLAGSSSTFTITVTDVNETPIAISASDTDIDENQVAGSTVLTFTGSDTDDNETYTFTLSGDDASDFYFSSSGSTITSTAAASATLLNVASFNYEVDNEYIITVTMTDTLNSGAASGSAISISDTFTIDINDLNDIPQYEMLDNYNIVENNNFVIEFSAFDQDGDTLTYSLYDEDYDTFFTQNYTTYSGSYSTLYSTTELFMDRPNYESTSEYLFSMDIDDGTDLITRYFTITVQDENDTPNILAFTDTYSLDEFDYDLGTGVLNSVDTLLSYNVVIADEDTYITGDSFVYTILSTDFSTEVDSYINGVSALHSVESNLVLWLDASNIDGQDNATISDGDYVTQWVDLSRSGFDFTQTSTADAPVYDATGFNGSPAVDFNLDYLENTSLKNLYDFIN